MSTYPNQIDTDATLPRIDNGITPITGEVINDIRDAVIAIEQAVGLNPQGDTQSLAARIGVSIDLNGNLVAAALNNAGYVSLPITNSQIANNAAILESKLTLNYPTAVLYNSIQTIATANTALQNAFGILNLNFNLHTAGVTLQHDGYAILINPANTIQYGVAGLTATTIGDAVNQLAGYLLNGELGNNVTTIPHINLSLPDTIKHQASEISVNTSTFTTLSKTATNVQTALDSIDVTQGVFGEIHVKGFHDNGIFRTITSGDGYNASILKVISDAYGASFVAQGDVVTFGFPIDGYSVVPGDILVLNGLGNYQVVSVGPTTTGEVIGELPTLLNTQVQVYAIFATTGTVSGAIYASATESSNYAPLSTAVRPNSTIVDTLTILNPNSAQAVSIGFNPALFYQDGYSVCITAGLDDGYTITVVVPNLNRFRNSTQANPVTNETVAERINAYLSNPSNNLHFPVSAFPVGNEIAIAHNFVGPQYTLQIVDGYNGNYGLGFDSYGSNVAGKTILGNINENFVVNGQTLNTIYTVFDGYGVSSGLSTNVMLYNNFGQLLNPLSIGLNAGDVLNVTDHPTTNANGSYTLQSTTPSYVSTFGAEIIPAGTFNVAFTNSNISLGNLYDSGKYNAGLLQLFINSSGQIINQQRLVYNDNMASGFGPYVSVIGISNNFPPGPQFINVVLGSGTINFYITSNTVPGQTFTIQSGFNGTFNLYHNNNIEYLTIQIIGNASLIVNSTVPIFTYALPNVDELLLLNTLCFNGQTNINTIEDNRLFGNLGPEHIRDDFINLYTQVPLAETRSDGVCVGFGLLSLPYTDIISGQTALPLQGGVAYVGGVRLAVPTQKVIIPANIANYTGVVGINQYGTIQFYTQPLSTFLGDGYGQVLGFGRILPLYQVTVSGGVITSTADVRLFISGIDNKIDIIVDQGTNNIGNFASLSGALTYVANYPNQDKLLVRILSDVVLNSAVVVPVGVSLVGASAWGGPGANSITTTLTSSASPLLQLLGDNEIKNISVTAPSVFNNSLVEMDGYNILIEDSNFSFTGAIGSANTASVALKINNTIGNVKIQNNLIANVFSGIYVNNSCTNLLIENNKISGVSGLGGSVSSGIYITSNDALNAFNPYTTNISVINNTIYVPQITGSADIRGIDVNIVNSLNSVDIRGNKIINTVTTSLGNGIKIENTSTSNKLYDAFIYDNFISGVQYGANDTVGVYVDYTSTAKVARNTISGVGQDGYAGFGTSGGIYIGASVTNADVSNNLIENGYTDFGIALNSTNTARTTISNNTVSNLNSDAYCLYLANVTDAFVSGNSFQGNCGYGVGGTGTVTNTSFSGNFFELTSGFIQSFNLPTATNCFFEGNKLPEASPASTDIILTTGGNSIGVNRNLLDIKAVSMFSGVSATTSSSTPTPYWALEAAGIAWTCVSTVSGNKNLYFNLNQLNNGAKLISATIISTIGSAITTTATIYKQSTTGLGTTAISSPTSLPFTMNGSTTIMVSDGGSPSTINYNAYTYYLVVSDTSTTGTDQISGLAINFKY